MKKVIEIIQSIKDKINEAEFVSQHKTNPTNFSRKKKLDFEMVFFFVLTMIKSNLDFDINHFFKNLNVNVVPSAITQRRSQIQYTAFEEILKFVGLQMPSEKTLKGYRVLAIDGMHGELPRYPELMEKYKPHERNGYPQFQAVSIYDVLNEFFLCANWDKSPSDERGNASLLIKGENIPQKSIFLFDRLYPSVKLIHLFKEKNKFLMRVSAANFFKEVKQFSESSETDSEITVIYSTRRANYSGHTAERLGFKLPCTFNFRCVKIPLKSGETEVLITNLSSSEFNSKEIGELYNMRWGIETSFNYLKNAVNIEMFIGVKENSIKQEFFSNLIVYSLAKIAATCAQIKYESKKNKI